MSDENLIGLTELIEQVRRELLATSPTNETDVPFLSIDSVELEMQITVKKEAKGKLKIYVLELGSGGSRDDVQKVNVKLSPLLNKERLLAIYKERYPERWEDLLKISVRGDMKGNSEGSVC
jgi:hypothetical protein